MKITKLVLKGFRGLRHLEVDLAPGLTFIVAMNGTGKTSIIEGLAAALGAFIVGALQEPPKEFMKRLIGEPDHLREWPSEPGLPQVVESSLHVEATANWGDLSLSWGARSQRIISERPHTNEVRVVGLDVNKKELHEKLIATSRSAEPLPLLAALRAQRAFRGDKLELPRISAESSVSAERLPRWAADPWLDIKWYPLRDRWFELSERRRYAGTLAENAYQSVLDALMRALDLGEVPCFNADFEDFMIKLPDEGWRAVGLMSDGWRAYVATVVAIALRCAEINPAQPDAARITPGVLLIDELEQHLHPELQLTIVDGLRSAFPLLQLIATTHSPLVLTDLADGKPDRVLRLDRDEDGAISVTPLRAPVGLNTVQVLTGAWFGLSSTLDDETLRELARHRDLLRKGPDAREERKILETWLRQRIGRYADTSVEELVLAVVAELEDDPRFKKLKHENIVALRLEVVAQIKAGLR